MAETKTDEKTVSGMLTVFLTVKKGYAFFELLQRAACTCCARTLARREVFFLPRMSVEKTN